MRVLPFIVCAIITIALVVILNIPLTLKGAKTPAFGAFLSPQQGFWQNAEADDQDFNGDLKFTNLQGNTKVYFDERLVPHIYAEVENDAYFVQGFLHAKFRLWQMEFQTHAAAGRLSEIMGETSGTSNFLKIDKFFRRLGMVYAAERSLKAIESNPITKGSLDAYTAGVNSYINSLSAGKTPFEYKLLNYKPEPWTNLKTALFLKYMSYSLAAYETDFELTNAKKIFSSADIDQLYPEPQLNFDPVIPRGTVYPAPSVMLSKPGGFDSLYANGFDSSALAFLQKPDKYNGSNNWAVSGSKTKSGAPILCNDPHLGLNLPSLWYEMQITTPSFSSYGVGFPGSPSIIIGFNDSIAWGVTNGSRDVKDYYEIKFRDSSMQEYLFAGKWVKSTFRKEIIKVKGQPDDVENIAMTVFGPVMYDHNYANKLMDGKYYAVRWKAHDASNELVTFNKLNHAHNYVDYKEAISTFECPGQNFIFASKSGDIAITHQGSFPAKWARQGDFLMPGYDSSYMWQADIPVNENPAMMNPERGFVSSANQTPVDETYPYYVGNTVAEPYRGMIINRYLSQMNNITTADMQQLQTNNYDIFAELGKPILLKYLDESKLDADEIVYVNKLKNWTFNNDIEEQGPTIFNVWWDSLETAVFRDEFSRTNLPLRWPGENTLVDALMKDSTYKFVDDIRTPATETLKDIDLIAFKRAYKQLKKLDSNQGLAWGKFKGTGVRHLLKLPSFSRLDLPIGGGRNSINASREDWGPSWRMIVQMSEPIEAYAVFPGGESGNPGSKYYDNFIDSWVAGKYYKILFLKEAEARANERIKWTLTFSKA